MKKLVIITFSILTMLGCEKKQNHDVQPSNLKEENGSPNLPPGTVLKAVAVEKGSKEWSEVENRYSLLNSQKTHEGSFTAAEFTYSEIGTALVFGNQSTFWNMYASVNFDDSELGNLLINIRWDDLNSDSKVSSEEISIFDVTDPGNPVPVDGMRGWGKCMKEAIERLYEDWENDPVGTVVCVLTGPLCAVGGGIACGIKEFSKK